MAINTKIQSLVYAWFGTNFFVGNQIKTQINMLGGRLPPEFKNRRLDDLGCGDGKITLRLKTVFQPAQLRGFDVNPSLVKRARKAGIDAHLQDLGSALPEGELAVMWGVLHHLKDREACIRRIRENYRLAFIREPVKNKALTGFEMGRPLVQAEIEQLIEKYLPKAQSFYYGHCIFIFYSADGPVSLPPAI